MPFSKLQDSVENGKEAFAWIIAPYDIEIFFRKVYVTNRKEPNYYGDLFSSAMFVEILQKNFVEYGTNINVALYNGDERKTLNGTGRVYPEQIKIHLKEGRSIQLINPQTFCDNVWYLCDTLQEFFGSFVGANTYLTPAGSAGFAPHWDDIDAFLMQIEGRKNWKVYAPQNECDELPRESSKNFSNDDMKNAKLIFEGWLEQGDLLYIPRGFIHQVLSKTHSLHLTVSFCRNTAFIDLLEKLLPVTLSSLANNLRGLRQSLPVQYLDMEGVLRKNYKLSDQFALRFTDFLDSHLQNLRAFSSQFYAAGLDMMACDFMKNALPPMLTQEKRLSVLGDSNFNIFGTLKKFKKTTEIRLLRRHTQRLFFETEDECFIAHRIENSRVSEGRPEVSDLRCSPEETNVELAELLYSNGILLARF
ncbi:unnamed protein product [Dracunculus medinensis]|uniref:Bifunctional lysine-specific demethylase and histidyl-hydroxylase n=1 Tax=Dracunculus medinensis TaxID=318479 RepID=A0A0N4U1B3_DRAME|nr:unnamed protein product [Dracunculus medinensis]